MRKNKSYIFIFVIAAVMLLIVLRFLFVRESPLMNSLEFRETVYGQSLVPYYDEKEDTYYLFLPPFVGKDDITVSAPDFVSFAVSEDNADNSEDPGDAPVIEDLTISVHNFYKNENYKLQVWQCSNLPTVYIETATGSMDEVNEDKDYEADATVLFIDAEGQVELENMCTLTGRGNATWLYEKKPYDLEFPSGVTVGPFEDIDTLCLLANYSDETRLRNAICYYAAEKLDFPYASPYMNVNVYADGEFLGMYGITTKEEYEKSIDTDQIQAVFETNTNTGTKLDLDDRCRVLYGDKGLVQDTIERFEQALTASDWDACEAMIDQYSFAQKYAFEEFIANHDFARGSSYQSKYFYLDKDGIIHCMLPWDYDWTLGSSRTYFNNKEIYELKIYRNENCWFALLLGYDGFVQDVVDVLQEEYTDAYIDDLMQYITWLTDYVEVSWRCDQARWKDEPAYHSSWDLSSGMEDLSDYIAYYRSYFPERRDFLIDCFSDLDAYYRVDFTASYDSTVSTTPEYANFMIPKGADLWDYLEDANILRTDRRPGRDFSGWTTEDGTSIYEIGTVTEDLSFSGKWAVTDTAGESEGTTVAGTSIFQEIRRFVRRIERRIGLNSFGRLRLAICIVFGLILLIMIVLEIRRWRRNRKDNRKENILQEGNQQSRQQEG